MQGLCCGCYLFLGYLLDRRFFYTALKSLENPSRVVRGLPQGIENPVAHFYGCLKSCFFAAVLAVGEVLGELIPLAADTQAPALEGCRLVGVPGYISLCHGLLLLLCVISGR